MAEVFDLATDHLVESQRLVEAIHPNKPARSVDHHGEVRQVLEHLPYSRRVALFLQGDTFFGH